MDSVGSSEEAGSGEEVAAVEADGAILLGSNELAGETNEGPVAGERARLERETPRRIS